VIRVTETARNAIFLICYVVGHGIGAVASSSADTAAETAGPGPQLAHRDAHTAHSSAKTTVAHHAGPRRQQPTVPAHQWEKGHESRKL
jgi:hypothetical protein